MSDLRSSNSTLSKASGGATIDRKETKLYSLRGLLCFCLGNPGLISYYIPFFTRLQTLIPKTYGIIAISHIGHAPDLSPSMAYPGRALSLTEQVEAKVEFIKVLQNELASLELEQGVETDRGENPVKIALIGHSVGAEMCVQVMKRLDTVNATAIVPATADKDPDSFVPAPIEAAFLLFPTLANIAMTPNGRRLRPIFHFPLIQILPLFAYLLQPLIWTLRLFTTSSVLTSCSSANEHTPLASSTTSKATTSSIFTPHPVTLSLLSSPRTIHHVLNLARSEMTTIKEPDLGWYSQNDVKRRIWSYWGKSDGWVAEQGDEIKTILACEPGHEFEEEQEESSSERLRGTGKRLVDCVDNVPHAFCLGE